MPSKEGWTHDADHDKITLGRKQYRNMEEWNRPCGVCGVKFSIFVRANGGAINSSFGLKTCKDHRGQKISGGVLTSDPELQKELTEAIKERDEAYEVNVELIVQNKELREALAKYELQPAMAEIKNKMPW